MPEIYAKQRKFFRDAYETGQHGWPETGPTPHVATLVRRLGAGRGKSALDLGCGEGRHTILLARRGYQVTALDLEPLALQKARAHVRQAGLRADFVAGNALRLRFHDAAFDLVLDYGCFHHVVTRDWPRYRREIARVLKPGGRIGISDVVAEDHLTPEQRAKRGSLVGCIAGALAKREYEAGLDAAGFEDVSVEFTHRVADGLHGAIVTAVKTRHPQRRGLPIVRPAARAGCR